MNIGDFITVGNYAWEPVVWRILAEKEGKYLLLSRDILEYRPYHPEDNYEEHDFRKEEWFHAPDWETCELRQWLNGEFLSCTFTEEEKEHIVPSVVYYTKQSKTLNSKWPSERKLENKLFILSYEQMMHYLPDSRDRYAPLTKHAQEQCKNPYPYRKNGAWWTRNHANNNIVTDIVYFHNFMDSGLADRTTGASVAAHDIGVRPAMWYQV